MKKLFYILFAAVVLAGTVERVQAFALMGPYMPWMVESNGYRFQDFSWGDLEPADIGGPMELGSGYRVNVPVLTYGFDQSFLDYFGTNGVAAVDAAFQTLNGLTNVSDLVLTNFPLQAYGANYQAMPQGIFDLKSVTLSLVLEHLGLAQPTRSIYAIKQWNPGLLNNETYGKYSYSDLYSLWLDDPQNPLNACVDHRNYDPETLATTPVVNGNTFAAYVVSGPEYNVPVTFNVDPFKDSITALADFRFYSGMYFSGLSRDDAGGLRYLYSPTNVAYERPPASVYIFPQKNKQPQYGAWRPGIGKINFVGHPINPATHGFKPFTYLYQDHFYQGRTLQSQTALRLVRQPDFLFSAEDNIVFTNSTPFDLVPPWIVRNDTSHWKNNAAMNGNNHGEGPGVIEPSVKIKFYKLGAAVDSWDNDGYFIFYPRTWGSFNGSTNRPFVVYPDVKNLNTNTPLRIRFYVGPSSSIATNGIWSVNVPILGAAALQVSSNQVDWTTITTVTNLGSEVMWDYTYFQVPKYIRAVPNY